MTGTAVRALVAAEWQQTLNREWRFSRAKLGAWMLLLQLGFGALAFWRLQPAAAGVGLGGAAALTGLQAAGWSFLAAFLSGRNKLYGGR
ncbi:MAG TPA: hypothetical protein VNT75_20375, partial [Symbiobacteriaceae bacterium]|nr:hypothetical protein [Symbiobacteriaceae bacterium]